MSKEIAVGSRYRFSTPSLLGGRFPVQVVEYDAQAHQVKYQYPGLPVFCMTRKTEDFLTIYSERVG